MPHCRRKDKSLPALCIRTLAPRMSSSIAVITAYLLILGPVHRLPCEVCRNQPRPPVTVPALGISVILLLFPPQVQTKGRGLRGPFCGLVPVRLTAVAARRLFEEQNFGLACIHVASLKAKLKHLRKTNTNKETWNVCVLAAKVKLGLGFSIPGLNISNLQLSMFRISVGPSQLPIMVIR